MSDGDEFCKCWGATEALELGEAVCYASPTLGKNVVIALL